MRCGSSSSSRKTPHLAPNTPFRSHRHIVSNRRQPPQRVIPGSVEERKKKDVQSKSHQFCEVHESPNVKKFGIQALNWNATLNRYLKLQEKKIVCRLSSIMSFVAVLLQCVKSDNNLMELCVVVQLIWFGSRFRWLDWSGGRLRTRTRAWHSAGSLVSLSRTDIEFGDCEINRSVNNLAADPTWSCPGAVCLRGAIRAQPQRCLRRVSV